MPMAFAYNCEDILKIVIKNDTQTNCHLFQKQVKTGYLKAFSEDIASGHESQPYVVMDDDWAFAHAYSDIVLSFQCGNDQFITLESLKTNKKGVYTYKPVVTGKILSLSNIDAHHSPSNGNCRQTIFSSIYWTIV